MEQYVFRQTGWADPNDPEDFVSIDQYPDKPTFYGGEYEPVFMAVVDPEVEKQSFTPSVSDIEDAVRKVIGEIDWHKQFSVSKTEVMATDNVAIAIKKLVAKKLEEIKGVSV